MKLHQLTKDHEILWNWVKKQKLPAIEAIKFNRYLYNKLDNL